MGKVIAAYSTEQILDLAKNFLIIMSDKELADLERAILEEKEERAKPCEEACCEDL